jgi:ATP adenylyltransferase
VTSASGEPTGCIFCDITDPGRSDLIVARGRLSFVILNLYPYNNGHLMVVPNRHVPNLASMAPDELAELMQLTRRSEMVLNEAYKPQGINVGINLGRPAGAGVADHLHVHLVPRWNGDTNFMTVVGNVRVVPESLDATKAKLEPIFARLALRGD